MAHEKGNRLGKAGEDAASLYLKSLGFEVIERNWRITAGEIDIIARKGNLTIFVEVKSRSGNLFGEPEESITPAKVAKLRALAQNYIAENFVKGEIRFDVISVVADRNGGIKDIRHIKDAF
jgi:putative endonuclease